MWWKLSIAALLGALLAWYLLPAQERIVYRERLQTRNNVTTVVREAPDGSKVTTIRDTSTTERTAVKDSQVLAAGQKGEWSVAFFTSGIGTSGPYTAVLQRRIVGPIFVGIMGSTDLEWGIGVGLAF